MQSPDSVSSIESDIINRYKSKKQGERPNLADKTLNPKKLLENENKKPKISLNTESTDLHFELLADPSKLKKPISPKFKSPIAESDSESATKQALSSSSRKSSSKSSSKKSESSDNISVQKHSEDKNGNHTRSERYKKEKLDVSENEEQYEEELKSIKREPLQQASEPPKNNLTPYERKITALAEITEMKDRGVPISRNYTVHDSLEEMEGEIRIRKEIKNKENGKQVYKNLYLGLISAVEFCNEEINPFHLEIDGLHKHMSMVVDSQDTIFEELYEKYKGNSGKMSPELRLLIFTVTTVLSVHSTNSAMKKREKKKKVKQGAMKSPDVPDDIKNRMPQRPATSSQPLINNLRDQANNNLTPLQKLQIIQKQLQTGNLNKEQREVLMNNYQNIMKNLTPQERKMIEDYRRQQANEHTVEDTESNINTEDLNSSARRARAKKRNPIKIE